ncbi:MAG TPA: thioredoxin domain-containing protein [Vicinamibacterales bacterium]|jgi:protein-disulfide isomerase|nr:thioredoxin domain-containing protein [Vicinamibacterales bacterium]
MSLKRISSALDITAAVAMIGCSVYVAWLLGMSRRPASGAVPVPTEPISIDGASVRGSSNAAVTVIEFADFQCPYCGTFQRDSFPEIDAKYVAQGRIRWAFRNLPLSGIHAFATGAAAAASCASKLGAFWPYEDLLFRHQAELATADLRRYAHDLRLDDSAFGTCLDGGGWRVADDVAAARALGINSTPTFLVGRMEGAKVRVVQRLSGAVPLEQFEGVLEAVMKGG